MHNEPLEATLKVTDIFEKQGVAYLISGSLASALYGMLPATLDADIVAEMRKEVSTKCVTLEESILANQEAYRRGGEISDRPWRDVRNVRRLRAGALHVSDRLERAFKEAS